MNMRLWAGSTVPGRAQKGHVKWHLSLLRCYQQTAGVCHQIISPHTLSVQFLQKKKWKPCFGKFFLLFSDQLPPTSASLLDVWISWVPMSQSKLQFSLSNSQVSKWPWSKQCDIKFTLYKMATWSSYAGPVQDLMIPEDKNCPPLDDVQPPTLQCITFLPPPHFISLFPCCLQFRTWKEKEWSQEADRYRQYHLIYCLKSYIIYGPALLIFKRYQSW